MAKKQERKEALDKLLRPIKWDWSSGIDSRQRLVCKRRAEVGLIMPFLTKDETARAKQWMKDERHEGLWD